MKSFRLGLTALVLLLGAGCMVGPDYSKPSVPMTAAYKEDQGWKLARPLDDIPRGKWWEIFGDPLLNALEEQVSEANQNVKIAEARFSQARALIGFFRAGCFPRSPPEPAQPRCAMEHSAPFQRHRSEHPVDVTEWSIHRRLSFDRATFPTRSTCGAASAAA